MREIPSIAELIATEERWCKDYIAYSKTGKKVSAQSRYAVRWCLSGARSKLFGRSGTHRSAIASGCIQAAIQEVHGRRRAIASFNDSPETSHADVLRVARRADELIRERLGAAP